MRIVESEFISYLADVQLAFCKKFFGFADDKKLDVLRGGFAEFLFYEVTEIVGRKAHFGGARLDRRYSFFFCLAGVVPVVQELFETAENTLVRNLSGDELSVVEQRTVTVSKIILKVLDMWELCINFAAVK